ncbi:MAG: 3-oxoacyl-[acyl-carrier-protein] reductase [bacterium]
MELKDKVALVTGAARGIGRAIALELARSGASVAVVDIDEQAAAAVSGELASLGVRANAYRCDVSDLAAVEKMVEEVLRDFGRIDILVNNAGITRDTLLLRMKEEEWDLVLRVNLKSAFNCTKAVSRHMLKQRSGRIVNISSVVGLMGNAGQANYAASKAGLIGFTKSVAKELASRGITVNAVAPGFIKTEMTDSLSDEAKTRLANQIPLGSLGMPEDVAAVVTFLASEKARYLTGQVVHVDGGMVMS